jgi:hypothetical protein
MTTFHSKLLRVDLPEASFTIPCQPADFFDISEAIARERGWRIDRRREYAGPGYDQLNLYLGGETESPMLRMVATPDAGRRLSVDVVANWDRNGDEYETYTRVLRQTARVFLNEYNSRSDANVRLGLPRRPRTWSASTVDCDSLRYIQGKFDDAVRVLALGEGDMRSRMESAYLALIVVQEHDLPEPLRDHWAWVVEQLTHRAARHQWEGTLKATLSQMRNTTAQKIAERIYEIRAALHELCPDEHYWMS